MQTRAFSFSDDSANVAFPFSTAISSSAKSPSKSQQLWLQNFDTATEFFKIRQIQSSWYADLFQSGRDAWPDPYSYIWKTYHEMTEWHNNISKATLPNTLTFFDLELLYSYVYVLSPSPRCPAISNYAQRLIFEHCIAYAIKLRAILKDDSAAATHIPLTFYDAMRAYMTGRQFVDVLARNFDVLLSPIPPTPPASSGIPAADIDPFSAPPEILPPSFPTPFYSTSSAENLADPTTRARAAIEDFVSILKRFGRRFGYINWRDRFARESAGVVAQLRARASVSPTPATSGQHPATSPAFEGYISHPGSVASQGGQGQQQQQVFPGYAPHHMPPTTGAPGPFGWGPGQQGQGNFGFVTGVPQGQQGAHDLSLSTTWETMPGGDLNARFSLGG